MTGKIEISLDTVGGILIPDSLRSLLGLAPGMILVVEKDDSGGLRLRLQSPSTKLVDKGGVLVVRADPISELNSITRQERDRRLFTLLQRAGL
jgi:bifunctional DNA-binding transcriptional regulator/antitoxin component of YhaV-PrlF toxin-antitoxin module